MVKSRNHPCRTLLLTLSIGAAGTLWADQIAPLGWLASPSSDVTGYAMYYGRASGRYDFRVDVGATTNAAITSLDEGTTYFFAVSAYDQFGVESELSNEISYTTLDDIRQGPWLAPISDRTIHAGSRLMISNFVADLDQGHVVLRFTLSQILPSTASIDATNGLFVWPTSESDVGATNLFTVQVADVTRSNTTDSKSFSVQVVELPSITSLLISNGFPVITWTSIPGQSYQLQYQNALGDVWFDVGPPTEASDQEALVTDSASAVGARFYRVRVCAPP